MKAKISGVALATPSAGLSARPWIELFGARLTSTTAEPRLGAERVSYAVGDGTVELLEPKGPGVVAAAVEARGPHLFAAVLDVSEPERLVRRPYAEAAVELAGGERLFTWDTAELRGLRVMTRQIVDRPVVGNLEHWYETTWLVNDPVPAVRHVADWLEVDAGAFVPNDDARWAYRGTLTIFSAGRLPRFEIVNPFDPGMPMGRFFAKFGPSLYMAFVETGQMTDVADRGRVKATLIVEEDEVGPHTIFVPPKELGGMLLGISRTDYAWNWSRGRVMS